MQRIASVTLASLFLLTTITGCSWFGRGKSKDTSANMYEPGQGGVTDPYGSQQYGTQNPEPYPYDTGATAGGGGTRYHTVQKKETLYSISRQYYGDHTKWKDIYAANRSEIGDPNKIRVGQRLVIPQ